MKSKTTTDKSSDFCTCTISRLIKALSIKGVVNWRPLALSVPIEIHVFLLFRIRAQQVKYIILVFVEEIQTGSKKPPAGNRRQNSANGAGNTEGRVLAEALSTWNLLALHKGVYHTWHTPFQPRPRLIPSK